MTTIETTATTETLETAKATINRSDLIDEMQAVLSAKTGKRVAKVYIKVLLDAALTSIKEALVNGQNVRLDHFGTFAIRRYAPTERINPKNPGERIQVEERNYPAFKPGKELRQRVRYGAPEVEVTEDVA